MSLIEKGILRKESQQQSVDAWKVVVTQNVAKGMGTGQSIVADMTGDFGWDLNSKWGELANGLIPEAVQDGAAKLGSTALKTGIFSQKYYQGGGDVSLKLQMKIFDDGSKPSNPVIQAAQFLSHLSVPDALTPGAAGAFIERQWDSLTTSDFAGQIADKGAVQGTVDETEQVLKNISDNNRTVSVKVGHVFFCPLMVIDSVSVKYSRQLGPRGPLFGEYDLGVSTYQSAVKGNDPANFGIYGMFRGDKGYSITINGKDVNGG